MSSSLLPTTATADVRRSPPRQTLLRTNRFGVPAAPEDVFPLLCPTREYDWIPGWRAELIHSVGGGAELGCVFRTTLAEGGRMTWVVTVYNPPRRIEFTCFVPDRYIMRLGIDVSPAEAGAQLTWTREWWATDPAGDAMIAEWSDETFETKMAALERLLVHYVRTGTMLCP